MPLIEALAETSGCDVFSYEYIGYSTSKLEGQTASEAGCLRSIVAAWRYLVDHLSIPPSRIIIFGRSIGSGPSVDLASRTAVAGECVTAPSQNDLQCQEKINTCCSSRAAAECMPGCLSPSVCMLRLQEPRTHRWTQQACFCSRQLGVVPGLYSGRRRPSWATP